MKEKEQKAKNKLNYSQEDYEDDGHTIVNMDVDGMPGNMLESLFGPLARRNPRQRHFDDEVTRSGYRRAKAKEEATALSHSQDQDVPPPLSRREFWALTLHTYLAALLILLVFFAAFGLLIWFIIRNN